MNYKMMTCLTLHKQPMVITRHRAIQLRLLMPTAFIFQIPMQTPSDPQVLETGNWVSELQTSGQVISFLNEIDQIEQGTRNLDDTHHTTYFAIPQAHGLGEGDAIVVTGAQAVELNGIHKIFNINSNGFEVDVQFKAGFTADSQIANWYRYPVYADPYSCQISFIFRRQSGAPGTAPEENSFVIW